jgi:DNA repair protein RecN (Recombination protein N)
MLKRIEIQNYAIIDRVTIDLDAGLNIITGETGAGKSILLGAIGLIMGERADTKVLYNTAVKCYVEATFDIAKMDLAAYFEAEDLDYSDELIIRREISASGKSRAFVNDTPVKLAVLKQLNSDLVDLHRQFDTLDIHDVSFQIKTLDALADNDKLLGQYQTIYRAYQSATRSLKELQEEQAKSLQEMDFLQFQYNELSEAGLEAGEQTVKEEQLERLQSTEDLKRIGQLVQHTVDGADTSVVEALSKLLSEADAIKQVDANLSSLYDRLYATIEELRDIGASYQDVADSAAYDPELAEELQSRLDLIYKLQNKHRVSTLDDLIEYQEGLETKLSSFTSVGDEIAALDQQIAKLEVQLEDVAGKLTSRRVAAVPRLVSAVEETLKGLSMPNARLKIEISPASRYQPTGMDDVAFLFASNKGSDFLPVKDVASGGEVARLTLAIKAMIADVVTLPTLIFDEIDTGVSGEVARKMGDIFGDLSRQHQVISITHSPQIAAQADKHFFVYKQDTEDRTITDIRVLDQAGRVAEVGKMLSGDPPSTAALANAKELIGA